MRTGYRIIATITVKDGKPSVYVNSNDHKAIELKDGSICVVEKKTEKFTPIGEQQNEKE